MNVTKWTPGPWEIDYLDENGQRVVRNENIEICTCWHHCVGSIEKEMEYNASLIAAAPTLYEAAQAHRAWSYAEKHNLGSFDQRSALCAHAESLTLRAMAQADGEPEPAYKGSVGMVVWPNVARIETEEAEGRALVALCMEHEQTAIDAARSRMSKKLTNCNVNG